MAEEGQDSREDLSDEASPYKLQEFREKGRVAQSRELSSIIALLAGGIALYTLAPMYGNELGTLMKNVFSTNWGGEMRFSESVLIKHTFTSVGRVLALLILPIAGVGFVLGALGSFVQIGSVFSTEPLTPDFSKINPISGLQRFFSMKHLYDSLRLVFRGIVVVAIAFAILKSRVLDTPIYALEDPTAILPGFASISKSLFASLCLTLLVFAGIDFWIQRWEFGKQVRLTKKEQKQEQKEHEGDPIIKARIRSIQREMARKRMMDAVKRADVIVTNPTHIAVALIYDKDKMQAPKVVAKGADFVAQKIKKIAAEAGIPMVENVPLARALYKSVKIGQYVPRVLFKAVAEILAYVYKLKNKAFV